MSKAAKRERQRQNREARREIEAQLARRRRTVKTVRNFAIVLVPVFAVGVILSLSKSGSDKTAATGSCKTVKTPTPKDLALTAPAQTIDPTMTYTATMITNCGTIVFELATQTAPISTNNFVSLAEQSFYDNLAVVRSSKNFVFQAGSPNQLQNDPNQRGADGPGYSVQGEVPTTTPAYPVGTVAFAGSGATAPGVAGSQFFIVTGTKNLNLAADYALIGHVTKGLAVAKRITKLAPASGDGPPNEPVVITSMRISKVPTPVTTTTSTP